MDKIIKKLKRDAQRSPKKAAALGLLCVVALWFWAPLVWGWIVPEGSDSTAESTPAAAPNPVPGPAAPGMVPTGFAPASRAGAGQPEQQKSLPWRTVLKQIDRDGRTRPARLDAHASGPATALLEQFMPWRSTAMVDVRDPFVKPKPPEPVAPPEDDEDEDDEPEQPVAPPDPSPEQLGAKVTSTVATSNGGGVAMVNGRVYRRGDDIELSDGDTTYRFRLAEVRGWGAVLTRNDKRYPLEIPITTGRPAAGSKAQKPTPKPPISQAGE